MIVLVLGNTTQNHDRTGNLLFAVTPVTSATDSLKKHTHQATRNNIDKTWSSQEWKSDELMDDRTVRPVVCPQRGAPQHFMEDDEAESDLSLGSRSFLHRVNDQVRKRQKRSSMNVPENDEKHSVIWRILCL